MRKIKNLQRLILLSCLSIFIQGNLFAADSDPFQEDGIWYSATAFLQGERELGGNFNLEFFYPSDLVFFDACTASSGISATQPLLVDKKINGKWDSQTKTFNVTKSWSQYSDTVDYEGISAIAFKKGGTWAKRYIRKIKVRMAPHIILESNKLAFDNAIVAEKQTSKQLIEFKSFLSSGELVVDQNYENKDIFQIDVVKIADNNKFKKIEEDAYSVIVTFAPKELKTYTSKVTIKDGKNSVVVDLVGTGVKRTPQINWNYDNYIYNNMPELATTDCSDVKIVYESLNPEFVTVDENNKLIPVANGVATIKATISGYDQYNPISVTKEFTVTTLPGQNVTWNQNFSELLTTTQPVNLTATSDVALLYRTDDESVAKIVNNQLQVVGEGETFIHAYNNGSDQYAPVDVKLPVLVYLDGPCGEYELKGAVGATSWGGWATKTYNLSSLVESLSFNTAFGSGTIDYRLHIYADGKDIWTGGSNIPAKVTVSLPHNTKKITIELYSTGYKEFSGVTVTRFTSLDADNKSVLFGNVEKGTSMTVPLTVKYANMSKPLVLSFENAESVFSVDTKKILTGCGKYGDVKVNITVNANVLGEIKDNLIISNGIHTIKVPVSAVGVGKHQYITWNQELPLNDLNFHKPFQLVATANSGLPVSFQTSAPEVATIGENNMLTVHGAGTVVISAVQAGDETFAPAATLTKEITIEKNNVTADAVIEGKSFETISINNATLTTTGVSAYNLNVTDGGYLRNTDEFVAGNVTYTKTIDNTRWFFFSVPFDCPISDIRFTTISGVNPEAGWTFQTDFRIMQYNQTQYANGGVDNNGSGWEEITDPASVLKANRGYIVAIVHENTQVQLDFSTAAEQRIAACNTNKTLDYGTDYEWFTQGTAASKFHGWNLISLPYYAPLNSEFEILTTSYVSFPKADGSYDQMSVSDALIAGLINPFEPFFIQNFENDARAPQFLVKNPNLLAVEAENTGDQEIQISAADGSSDVTTVIVNPDATNGYEIGLDLLKLNSKSLDPRLVLARPQIYSVADGSNLAFNAIPNTNSNVVLGVSVPAAGDYTIASPKGNLFGIKLIDKKGANNKWMVTDIAANSYTAHFDAAGEFNDRFVLTWASNVPVDVDSQSADALVVYAVGSELVAEGLSAGDLIRVYDAAGRLLVSAEADSEGFRFSPSVRGVYNVVVVSDCGVRNTKVVY